MTKPTTARSTFPDPAIIAADDAFFAVLLETYPKRDVADQARAALHDVLAEADNAGQLKVCLPMASTDTWPTCARRTSTGS